MFCTVFCFPRRERLFWRRWGWCWQQSGRTEMNQIRENPVLRQQTAAKSQVRQGRLMMTVLSVYRLLFFFFNLFHFRCLFVCLNTHRRNTGFPLGQQIRCAAGSVSSDPTVVPAHRCRTCRCVIHSPWETVDPNPVLVNHDAGGHHPQEDLRVALVLKVQADTW